LELVLLAPQEVEQGNELAGVAAISNLGLQVGIKLSKEMLQLLGMALSGELHLNLLVLLQAEDHFEVEVHVRWVRFHVGRVLQENGEEVR